MPSPQGIKRDRERNRAIRVERGRKGEADEGRGEAGKGTKKRAIKSKGRVGAGKAETQDLNLNRDKGAVKKEKEGAAVPKMAPDMLMWMALVIVKLKGIGFLCVLGRNFILKMKIMLEKRGMIHYDISRVISKEKPVS